MRLLFLLLPLFVIACNSNPPPDIVNQETKPVQSVAATSKLSEAGTKKLIAVLNNYYALKDALVATSAAKANTAAQTLSASIDSFRAGISTADTAIMFSINNYIDTVKMQTTAIVAENTTKTNLIRKHFSNIANSMFSICKISGLKDAGVYWEFCPMANDDTGAHWLSNYSEIKNPYFGDKMLECGDVEDSLK